MKATTRKLSSSSLSAPYQASSAGDRCRPAILVRRGLGKTGWAGWLPGRALSSTRLRRDTARSTPCPRSQAYSVWNENVSLPVQRVQGGEVRRSVMSATGLDVFDKTLQTTHLW